MLYSPIGTLYRPPGLFFNHTPGTTMQIPAVHGTIRRRILANYRAEPSIVQTLLPRPFRPKLFKAQAIVGICLIRLEHIRPQFLRPELGLRSENAAHRIAVEWSEDGKVREGVYIARRDSNSWLNAVLGGRVFPGEHHHARFEAVEDEAAIAVAFESADGTMRVAVRGRVTAHLPPSSIFPSLAEASDFFAAGSRGYSVTRHPQLLDSIELKSHTWHVEPLTVEQIESSFFDDHAVFPQGSVVFDSALVMRNVPHAWHGHGQFQTEPR